MYTANMYGLWQAFPIAIHMCTTYLAVSVLEDVIVAHCRTFFSGCYDYSMFIFLVISKR